MGNNLDVNQTYVVGMQTVRYTQRVTGTCYNINLKECQSPPGKEPTTYGTTPCVQFLERQGEPDMEAHDYNPST